MSKTSTLTHLLIQFTILAIYISEMDKGYIVFFIEDLDTSNFTLLDYVQIKSIQIESVKDIKQNISDSSALYWARAAWMVGERDAGHCTFASSKL